MKKIIALILVFCMALTVAACAKKDDPAVKSEGVVTYEEYAAADLNAQLVIETYVQAKQSWWDNKATLYTQDMDGAYFVYDAACSEEDYEKLVPGAKVKVTGYKGEWSGEVEIMDGTIEVLDGNYIAPITDATALLGTDELIANQNKYVAFKGLTVEDAGDGQAFLYGWDGSGEPGSDSDLYFNASVNGQTYTFVIEYYLCNETTEAYQAVQALNVGDVIDLEGFLYWYEGPQPHITSVKAAA